MQKKKKNPGTCLQKGALLIEKQLTSNKNTNLESQSSTINQTNNITGKSISTTIDSKSHIKSAIALKKTKNKKGNLNSETQVSKPTSKKKINQIESKKSTPLKTTTSKKSSIKGGKQRSSHGSGTSENKYKSKELSKSVTSQLSIATSSKANLMQASKGFSLYSVKQSEHLVKNCSSIIDSKLSLIRSKCSSPTPENNLLEIKKDQSTTPKSTNSDERLCRAFSVDRSLTLTAKASISIQKNEIKETDEQLDVSIRRETDRALSFLENIEENKNDNDNKSKKFKLRLSKKIFVERKQEIISSSTFHSQLYPTPYKPDPSLFSTQDSGPSKSKSIFQERFSPGFTDRQYLPEDSNNVHLNNYPFPKLPIENSEEEHKKKRIRKSHPIFNSKDFDIVLDKITQTGKTTLMIKNIPNRYTKEMMLELIDKCFVNTYDFFYLPIDFDNNCNVGYAFINFIEVSPIRRFYLEFNRRTWPHFKSDKIAEITYARIQGRDSCAYHFKDSSLMKQQNIDAKPFISYGHENIKELVTKQKQEVDRSFG